MLAVVMLQFFWQAAFGQIVENAASDSTAYLDAELLVREPPADSYDEAADTVQTVVTADNLPYGLAGKKEFNPLPDRAVWLSALFQDRADLQQALLETPYCRGWFYGAWICHELE